MPRFFAGTRPGYLVTHGDVSFELPILYFRDDFFGLYFTADRRKVEAVMPSEKIFPVLTPNNKAIVVVSAYNYIATSIGSFGEIHVAIPVVYGKKLSPFSSIIPALIESRYPGFGMFVYHSPVTNFEAREAGRGEWGYNKFAADMHFDITPEYLVCKMSENHAYILEISVRRKGIYIQEKKPIITFSVKNNKLLKTVISQQGTKRISFNITGSSLKLSRNHAVALIIRELGISSKPFMTYYYPEHSAILPDGEVIEENVNSYDRYIGKFSNGKHTVSIGEIQPVCRKKQV